MKDYKHKLYDFTPDQIFARLLMAVVIGITIATAIVFVKTARVVDTYPMPDYLVSDDMAEFIVKYGNGQNFEEGDMQ